MVEGAADLGWLETVARLALAGCLGGLLGLEREYDGQDAGFRTHLLVVVGSALFAVLSVGAFDDFLVPRADSNVSVDVTRIAAYVAPGIGFIGGGAILKHGGKVSGITTAASLWSAAAIGVACGLGFWVGAVAVTILALIALEVLQPVSALVARVGSKRRSAVMVELADGCELAAVVEAFRTISVSDVKRLCFGHGPGGGHRQVTAEFWSAPGPDAIARLVEQLRGLDGVESVEISAER